MKTLTVYIVRAVLAGVGISLLAIGGIVALATFVGELGDFGGDYRFIDALQYTALSFPHDFNDFLPVVVLIGALLGLGNLAHGSELMVMRSSGISLKRLALATLWAAVPVAIVAILISEFIGPPGAKQARELRHANLEDGKAVIAGNEIWLRTQKDFIQVKRVLSATQVGEVTVYSFDDEFRLRQSLYAPTAEFTEEEWLLKDVRYSRFRDASVQVSRRDEVRWPVEISADLLSLAVVQPDELDTLSLIDYIDYLQRNGQSAQDYELALWRNFALPITILVMTILALPFSIGSLRSTGTGQRLFIGVLIGVVFIVVNELTANTGKVLGLTPWLSAWLPTLLLTVAVLFWLYRTDQGARLR